MPPGLEEELADRRDVGRVPVDPGNPGPEAGGRGPARDRPARNRPAGARPWNVTVEPACAIPVAGMHEGAAVWHVRIPGPLSRRVNTGGQGERSPSRRSVRPRALRRSPDEARRSGRSGSGEQPTATPAHADERAL